MQTPNEQLTPMASTSQTGSHKRKRELLPLGTPPAQLSTVILPTEQRPVLRVGRACNTCRRQKMRCDGADKGPPCVRCKNSGVECVFEKVPPNRGPVVPATNRITSLEAKMEIMQSTQVEMHNSIQEILSELRRRPVNYNPSGIGPVAGNPLSVFHAPEAHKPASHSPFEAEASLSSPFSPLDTPSNELANPGSPHLPSILLNLNPSLPPLQSLLSPCPTPPESLGSSSRSNTANRIHDSTFSDAPRESEIWPHPSGPTPPDYTRSLSDHSAAAENVSTPRPQSSNDKLPGGSEHQTTQSNSGDTSLLENLEGGQANAPKRRRIDTRQVLRDDGSRAWNPEDHIKEFRMEDSTYPDAIKRGLLLESDAHNLFNLFFERCHPRMPIFDPKIDTFDSLRYRSPFCLCCVLMAATKAQDGGNQPSSLQLALWDEALARAKESMFQRVKDLEVIQGLLLLSAWSESTGGTCWIVAGHAIRCGVEMGIHKALARLAYEPHNVDEEITQVLVSSARVWCALFAFGKLSFGIGRHTMTGHPKSIKNAREILIRHPLSNDSDMRLVSACELMLLEYQILETLPTTDAEDPRCQAHLREGRLRMDTWHADWEALLSPIFPPEHYMRQTITVQRSYGYMTVHMACMSRVITSADIDTVSRWEKENCFYTVSAAKEILRISVEEASYRDGLRYSPTCFYSGVSFVGALMLRLGSVLQGEGEYITTLLMGLSRVLEDVPTCRFKFSFTTLLQENTLGTKSHDPPPSTSATDVTSKHNGHEPPLT